MASVEMVTVRMSRGDIRTPWGFDIIPPCTVTKIIGSSLADRAGLQNGDHIDELQGLQGLSYETALNLLQSASHEIELVVLRDPTIAARFWKPQVTVDNMPINNFQGYPTISPRSNIAAPQSFSSTYKADYATSISPSIKVSLEHQPVQEPNVPGFNRSPQPYQPAELNNNQVNYSKPLDFPSYSNRAEQYLLEKGGLFGTDPIVMKAREQPSYLQSETLKLIQEEEKNGKQRSRTPMKTPDAIASREVNGNQKLPSCFICGRSIIGVTCRIKDALVHPECFQCSTCGSSLRNVGHHFINEKFYCDIHGPQRQQQLGGGNIKGTHFVSNTHFNPDLAVKIPPTAAQPTRVQEPPRGFYQPDILSAGLLSPPQPPIRPPLDSYSRTTVYSNQQESNNGQRKSTTIYEQQRMPTGKSLSQPPPNDGGNQTFTDGIRQQGTLVSQTNMIPYCEQCKDQIRGAYVLATGLTYCPEHFTCTNPACNRRLLDTGFVEEKGKKYCEKCFETLIAPICNKCGMPITADCLTALQKQWHPECFVCHHCSQPFGNAAFYLENGRPYCEQDWNMLFTTKCVACKYPIEAGDRWVEAIGSAFHSNCFSCTVCHTNLEGQSFYAKNGLPFCRIHA